MQSHGARKLPSTHIYIYIPPPPQKKNMKNQWLDDVSLPIEIVFRHFTRFLDDPLVIVVFLNPGQKTLTCSFVDSPSHQPPAWMAWVFPATPRHYWGLLGVVTRCHLDSTRHGFPGIPGDPGKLKPISMKDGRRGTAPAPPFAPVDAGTDIEVETGAPSPWRPTPGKPIYFR